MMVGLVLTEASPSVEAVMPSFLGGRVPVVAGEGAE